MKEISIDDASYPAVLKEISKPPTRIFVRGELNAERTYAENASVVAIVGTRRPTPYGKDVAYTLARNLASRGVTIVSGLALGIDAEAHRGALEGGGVTWAVLGSGIENVQPTYNRKLADEIIEKNGCIISEYSGTTEATKWTFPARNRIVAGLSHAVIIVEAPIRSGSLITARLALDANREVGAVPGEVSSVQSQGTNALLREGASLVRSADDVFELLGRTVTAEEKIEKLDNVAQNILHSLNVPKTINEIVLDMGNDIGLVQEHLTYLEVEGVVENNGGTFRKVI